MLAAEPNNFAALVGLADCLRRIGRHTEAAETYRAASAIEPANIWLRLTRADELRLAGQLADSEAECRAILALQPGHLDALMGIGHCHRFAANYAAAAAAFQAAHDAHPDAIKPLLSLAEALRSLGLIGQSEEACRKALLIDPNNAETWTNLAYSARAQQRHADAIAAFEVALSHRPGDLRLLVASAEELLVYGQTEAAEARLRDALARAPDSLDVHLGLAHTLRRRGAQADALTHFTRAVSLAPGNQRLKLTLADQHRMLGQIDQADALCQDVLAAEPDTIDAWLGMAQGARRRADYAAALGFFEQAAARDPQNPRIRAAIADALRDLGRNAEAAEASRALLDSAPDDLEGLMGLGLSMRRLGERAGALDAFSRAATAHPGEIRPALALAEEYRDAGEYSRAVETVESVLAGLPSGAAGSADAWVQLGRIRRMQGDRAEAFACYLRAIELAPGNANPMVEAGAEAIGLGRIDDARDLLNRALALAPEDVSALIRLGEVAQMAFDLEGAIGFFQRAIASAPGNPRGVIALSQALVLAGRTDEAEAMLARAAAGPSATPDLIARRAELRRLVGDYYGAQRIIEDAPPEMLRHFGFWFEAVRCERLVGNPERVAWLLDNAPAHAPNEKSRVLSTRGAEANWDHATALDFQRQALELDPFNRLRKFITCGRIASVSG